MKRMGRGAALVSSMACAVSVAHAAPLADEKEEAAKAHFAEAVRHHRAGRFEEAIEEYQRAYDASPLPDFLFNMGQCHRVLKNYDRAIFFFERYREDAPTRADERRVKNLLTKLRQEREDDRRVRTSSSAVDLTAPPPPPPPPPPPTEEETPIYKAWWFWTVVSVVVAGSVTGVVVGTQGRPIDGSIDTFDYR